MKSPGVFRRIVNYFWRQWRDELTPAGKCLVAGICCTGLGTVSVQVPIYQLFCGLVTFLAIAAATGWLYRPRLQIAGSFPERARANVPLMAMFHARNLRRLPAYDVGLTIFDLPPSMEMKLDRFIVAAIGPGQTATIPMTLTPKRRGRYQLPPLRAYSTFPFYIGRSGRRGQELSPLLVLPAYEPLALFALPIGSRHQPGGIALSSRIGESPEYIGNREYIPGEPVRRLDFRAWARTGRPVVREYQEEYYSRVAIILDTFVHESRRLEPNGFSDLEAAISLTASTAEALSDGEYIIDLFATGPELHIFQAGRSRSHFENVLDILAAVEPTRKNPFPAMSAALVDELERVSSVICFLTNWNESRREFCELVQLAGCRLKVVLVLEEEDRETAIPDLHDVTVLRPSEILRGGIELR